MELLEDRLAPTVEPTFRGGLTVAAADIDGDRIPDFIGAPSADAPVRVAIYAGVDGRLLKNLTPFEEEFTGGAFVAVGDVSGDSKPEVIVAAASGEPRVVVLDPLTGAVKAHFLAYDMAFGGGVRLAVGDVDGDGRAEIVTAPGTGGGPHIRVFDGAGRNLGRDYMAYDSAFRGGASVAVGDTDGDGVDDIITGAGTGGGPHVVVVSGRTGITAESYFAYSPGFQGGVWVAAGDVDGNGLADVITGAGVGGGSHVRVFAGHGTPFAEWLTYEPEFHGGVRVAAADLNGDGFADVITGPGVGGGPRVTMWDGYRFARTQDFFGVTDGEPLGFGLLAPPPRTPLYDGVTFVAPGVPGTRVRLASDVLRRFTDLPGELGVFRVDDREGRVGSLLPGAEGYGQAALAPGRRTPLFTLDTAPGTGGEFELEGGTRYGFYLIRGGRYEDWVASGFTDRFELGAVFPFALANPGGTQQFRVGPRNRAAFEDVSGLDSDFNDVIVDVRLAGEASDLPGGAILAPNELPANRPPEAMNDAATTEFETPVLISVLSNDIDLDGNPLSITSATKPAHGTLRVLGSHVEYTPDTGFKGVDAFSYTIADGRGGTDTAGVIVTVGSPNLPPLPPTNHPPVAEDDVVATAFETAVTIDVLANDTDTDTDPLSVTGTTQPLNGSVRIVGGRIEYAPAIGFRGIDTFEYTIEDGRGGKNTAVVTVSVGTPIGNNPPVARDDTSNTRYETTVSIDVLANDTDPDGDPLTISLAEAPTHGTARLSGNRIEYSPASGFAGADTLTYTVRDGRGGTSTATVRVSVELPTLAMNRPPDAVNDTALTAFERAVSINVLANDTDPDGDPLTVAIAVAPIHGTIRLVGTRIEYTPDAGYQGVDVFHYTVADGRGGGDMASVSVTVGPPALPQDFTDWTPAERGGSAAARGTVSIAGTAATLREGDSFVTTLSRSFTVVAGATPLQFTFTGLQFDFGASSFVKDSFEAALVDSAGNALVSTYSRGRDAFFNVTDGQTAVTGAGTSLDAQTVTLDLSAIPVGTAATLIFRLVNNDSDRGSAVTLTSYALPTTVKADAPVKFFVVDAAADKTFRYGVEGLSAGQFVLPAGEVRGVASNPAGNTVWTVDRSTKQIRVFDATGNTLGNWTASDAISPEGVTVNNGDLWLVDRGSHTVRHYTGGAVRRSGAVVANDSFALAGDNTSPSDLVTDGSTVWVTDDGRAEVFVYDVSGAQLGRWHLDGDNAAPSGITRNPAGGTDLWVLDRATKQVFQYSSGANFRSGPQAANGTFNLALGNSSPEGIADPPITDPDDFRGWQGANVGTFAQLYLGSNTPENRQIIIDQKLLDDGIFDTSRALSASLIEPGFNSNTGRSLDASGNGSYVYTYSGFTSDADAVAAGSDIDDRWFQSLASIEPGRTVYELPAPSVKAAVFPTIDHGPLPLEAIESTAYLSNDGITWNQAVVQRVWLEGWQPNLGIKWDGFVYAVGTGTGETFRFVSLIHGGPGALQDDGDDEINAVVGLNEDFSPARPKPPIISVSATGRTFTAGSETLLSGLATADQPQFADGSRASNRIVSVTVNGTPVDLLDDSGDFWANVSIRPGENGFRFVATDAFGLTAETTITLSGETHVPGRVDSSQFVDLTSGFRPEYARTSFRDESRTLFADVAVRNVSQYPAGVPLYVGVKNISDPVVRVTNAAGTLPDGTPYYDFTGLVTGGAAQLAPDAATGTLSLTFSNPNRGRFTYDLVFLGVPNRPPAFTTIPGLEATVGREYRYNAAGTDPDGDALRFTLVSGPTGMSVDAATGVVTWTPTGTQVGNLPVTLLLDDRRGGTAEQTFTVASAVSRPNRPPVFTTLPVGTAQVGQAYRYDADAADPDRDALTYSLAPGFPTGMTINATTGVVTWTPTYAQLVDTDVTVVADDGRGGTARQNYTICVLNDANRPPVIVSEPVRTTRLGEATAVKSTFDTDSEGWVSKTLLYPNPGSPPDILGTQEPNYSLTNGNPGGFIGVADPDGSLPVGNTQYWSAPAKFLGNQAKAYGGSIAYDLIQSPTANPYSQEDVILVGGGLTLVYDNPINPNQTWTNYKISLFETGWKLNNLSGPAASQSQMRAVLSSLSAMYIRGEYELGPDSELIDNVILRVPAFSYVYDVEALDPDGGPLTYSLTQAPMGMTIDPTTGEITWGPTQASANQSFPVTVRADDGRGGSDEQKFTVTVKKNSPTAREFDPVVEWAKGTFSVRPGSDQVMMTPAVIDLNGDGTPDIVFITFGDQGIADSCPGVLRAISGRDGAELWSVSDPSYAVEGFAGLAVGDIDRDGRPEVVALAADNRRLLAFEDDGTPKWASEVVASGGVNWGAPALADLDHDGTPEIVFGAAVLNADGTVRWAGSGGSGDNGDGPLSIIADLDLDGSPEVLAGNTTYRADGSVYWRAPVGDGFTAVGTFNADPFPEIVLVSQGTVSLLAHDGSPLWGPVAIPGGGRGGAPTVADFDNDGQPEIGVAGASAYTVFETDGTVKWSSPTQDNSSNVTGSSVFDFDGDGQAEVVYGDELNLRIYRGTDGTVLYSLPNPSGTTYEYPVIADVDGDGNAEIVAVANNYAFPGVTGIRVIGDRNNTWVDTRKIWNQHSYHITNVNDDGTIPAHEANSWAASNTYRLNVLTSGFDLRATPDLVLSSVSRAGTGTPLAFTARVENAGYSPVSPGAAVSFYDGDPAKRGTLVGTVHTVNRLRAGEHEDVTVTLSAPAVNDLWVKVDPDNLVAEFDDDNNALRGMIDTDPVNYAPRLWREVLPGELSATANSPYRLPLPVSDPDGDALTYSLVTGPDGLMVHPKLGVVAWVPKRSEEGTHQVVLKAVDALGNISLVPFAVTVVAPNTPPVITSTPPAGPAVVGSPFTYAVTAQDAEDSVLAYKLEGAPSGSSISTTGIVSWTPTPGQLGIVTFTVIVRDSGAAEARQVVSLSVVNSAVNHPPTAVALASNSAWLGRTYIGQVVGADDDGDPLRYTLSSGPLGMTIDAVSGLVTWQPVSLSTAPESVAVLVSDGRGGETAVNFAVTVLTQDTNRAPAIISVAPRATSVGSLYSYNLASRDPDGDPVVWNLVSGPQGASLDTRRGTLRWTPAHDQIGPVQFTVRARDPLTAEGTQTFTVNVSCENQPPSVVSTPPTTANAGFAYLYAVRATDAEGDPLTFSFAQAPAGMAFVPGTSLIRWTPTTDQAGPQNVVIRMTDAAGNVAEQSFTVVVSLEVPNRPPVITSRPVVGAAVGRAYSYQVAARDLDGDAITYALSEKPDGMTISPSGLIAWNPTSTASARITVEVTDSHGGLAVQSFTLVARVNSAPALSAVADGTAPVGGSFRVQVRAIDPEGDLLTFRLDQAPAGMTIDAQGRIAWTAVGPPRKEVVTVTVLDPDGLSSSKSFTIAVVADTSAPKVTVSLSHTLVNLGLPVTVSVRATDNVGVSNLTLTVVQGSTSQPLALDSQGRATFTPAAPGRYTFVASAADPSGNVGEGRAELKAVDPSATGVPEVSFTRLSQLLPGGQSRDFNPTTEVASVTYLTDVFGTIHDPDGQLDSWQVYVGRADLVDPAVLNPSDPFWQKVASGTAEVNNGKIFTFDPTTLQNDRYSVLVVVYNFSGRGTVKGFDIDVTGNAKLGEFRLEFTDLSLPLNGIPIQITRIYDTRDSAASNDFGYGWTLGITDAKIRETVPPGAGDGLFSEAKAFHDGTKVYLNLPDGGRAGFTFKPVVAGGSFFGTVYAPKFIADPGVAWKLEVDNSSIHPNAKGEFQTLLFPLDFNPDNYRLVSPDGQTYSYNQYTGLQRIDDKNGNFVTFAADGITHSGGRHISFVRDGQNRITDIIDPNGKSIHYAYTAAGDLKSVTDQANQTTQITYRSDRPHYLDEIRDPLGRRAVKTEYDANGRVSAIIDANGNRTEQSFDPLNFRETVRDANGNATLISYNDRGNVVRTELATDSGPIVKQTFYEDALNPDKETKTIDPRGFVTSKSFDARGNTLTENTADGTTRYTYSDANKVLSVTDTLGRVTAYDYTTAGNLVRVVNALGDSSSFTYDALGRVATFADFAGNVTKFLEYCECGRPMKIQNPDGSVRRIETNGFSQITKTIDELGNTTENVYDSIGRLIRVIDGEGHATNYEYEAGTANVRNVSDPLGNVTRYDYDSAGRKTRITDAEGGVTSFTYDANGNQTTVTDPVNNVTTFVYDQANRVKEEVDPIGASRFYQYDAAGNMTQEIDRNGRKRTFEYDPMNRLTAEKWWAADGSIVRVISSGYDKAGNLLNNTDPDAILGYTYDALNRVRTATTTYPGTNVPTVTLTYGYDKNGNRISGADNLGVRQDSVYGSRNELLSRTMTGTGVDPTRVEFEYRANGERTKLERFADAAGTAIVDSSTYDYYNNGLSKTIVHANAAGATLVRYDYIYDDAGRLTQETHHGDTYQYGYDRTSQLLTVVKDGLLYESFSYDKNSNRIAVTGPAAGVYQTGLGNRYITDGTFTYTYYAEGNTKTKTEISTGKVTEYFWDYRDRLVKVEERSTGGVVLSLSEYSYDPQGRRISQNANGEVLLTAYQGENAWADFDVSGAFMTRYVFGDHIDEILSRMKSVSGTAWYLTDKLGTIRNIIGAAGTVDDFIAFSAFGQVLSQTNMLAGDRYTFTGRELSNGTEYYYRARYYDSMAGRFIAPDPLGYLANSYNLFSYVHSNPLNATDPTGNAELFEDVLQTGVLLGLGSGYVGFHRGVYCELKYNYTNGGPRDNALWNIIGTTAEFIVFGLSLGFGPKVGGSLGLVDKVYPLLPPLPECS